MVRCQFVCHLFLPRHIFTDCSERSAQPWTRFASHEARSASGFCSDRGLLPSFPGDKLLLFARVSTPGRCLLSISNQQISAFTAPRRGSRRHFPGESVLQAPPSSTSPPHPGSPASTVRSLARHLTDLQSALHSAEHFILHYFSALAASGVSGSS